MGFPVSSSGTLPVAVPGSQQEVSAVLGDSGNISQQILTVQQYFYSTANSIFKFKQNWNEFVSNKYKASVIYNCT